VKKGDTVLVHAAAGGLGSLVTQAAKYLGAFVIGTCSTEEKAKVAKESGCDEVILYTKQDFETEVKRITSGKGVNVVYDSVGKDTVEKSLNCVIRRGSMIACGNASGKPPLVDLLTLKGSITLCRPTLGDYIATHEEFLERFDEVMKWIQDGTLKINIHGLPIPLAEASKAHQLLEGRQSTGKILLKP